MDILNLKQKKPVSWAIFLMTLGAVLIAMTSVVFPNLIMLTKGTITDFFGLNPYQLGIMAGPLLITNLAILVIAILFFKKKIPKIARAFGFIQNFEISTRLALLVMILLIGGFITFTAGQLTTEEPFPDYYNRVKPALQAWSINDVTKGFDLHLKNFLITTSLKLFGSYRVVPYLGSISLLILTYFFTKVITKNRFASICSVVIMLQSAIFQVYSASVAYDNFWILFYLLSLYLVYKFWPASPFSFIATLFDKPLTIVFLPYTLFFIYRTSLSRRKKILSEISYGIVIAIGAYVALKLGGANISSIDWFGFWSAFNAFTYQLRFDPVIVLFLLPVTVLLFLRARKGVIQADSILLLLLGTVLSQPLTAAFTPNSSEPYRFMDLVTFFSISVGMLLSRNYREGTSISQKTLPESPLSIKYES